jgi:uncharacterized delta-60 repeat protein
MRSNVTHICARFAMDISKTLFQRLGITLLMVALLGTGAQYANAQDGSLDTSFQPGAGASYPGNDNSVYSVLLQVDGKILIGGNFTLVNNVARGGVARLNPNGSLDTSFNPGSGANGPVNAMALQPDGKVIIAGDFAFFNTFARNRIARLNADGSLDPTFTPVGPSTAVYALALQADGKIVLGGTFFSLSGKTLPGVVRLNADGSLDTSFTPGKGANDRVNAVLIQPDGKILVAGRFNSFDNIVRNNIARLNPNGTLDASFGLAQARGYGNSISALALQGDGKVIAAGSSFSINGAGPHNVVRLDTNGLLDPNFDFQVAGSYNGFDSAGVLGVFLQTDGKVVVGGNFNSINTIARHNVARLNANGSVDTSFDPGVGPSSSVYGLVVQPDGKTIIGGAFTSVDGRPRNNIARLNAIPDATLQFSAAAYSVAENAGSVALTVILSGYLTEPVSVTYTITGVTADSGSDYTGTSGTTLIFFPLRGGSQQILIPILNNSSAESNETFTVTLSGIAGSAALGTPSTATVTIVDDDMPPQITSAATASGMVGQPFSYQITASNGPTSFSATADVTGLNSLDFNSDTGVISGTPTAAGTFSVTLTARNAVGTGSATLTLTILPPPTPTVTITSSTPQVVEGGARGTYIVNLDSAATTDLTIHYKVGGSAFVGFQYKPLKGFVVVPAGSSSALIRLKPYHDGFREGSRVVKVTLTPGDGYLVGDPIKAKIKVIDLD